MTATKFMAIYSVPKKLLLRKIVFQHQCYGAWFMEWWRHDAEFFDNEKFHWYLTEHGEDFVLVDMDYYWMGHEVCHAAIDDALWKKHGTFGIMPGDPRGRCAVVDRRTGIVDDVVIADDEHFRPPFGFVAVNDPLVGKGDVYDFRRKCFVSPTRARFLLTTTSHFALAA